MTAWRSETEYLRAEWDQFFEHPQLGQRTLDALDGRDVSLALDVGCGAGQELIPFVRGTGALGVAVDRRQESLLVARDLLSSVDIHNQVVFVCARAEALPLRSKFFDAVVCRNVLRYTDIATAVAELARTCSRGAVVIVQVNNLRYELVALRRHLRSRNWRHARNAARQIAAGIAYQIRGRQPTNSRTGTEVFFSRRQLERELARAGLRITGEVPHGNPRSFALTATPVTQS